MQRPIALYRHRPTDDCSHDIASSSVGDVVFGSIHDADKVALPGDVEGGDNSIGRGEGIESWIGGKDASRKRHRHRQHRLEQVAKLLSTRTSSKVVNRG